MECAQSCRCERRHIGRANGVSNLDASTPLWFYILREAQKLAGGSTLGPGGGRIVASLCYALFMTSVAAADLLNRIQQQGRLSPEALHNLQQWLEDPSLAEFAPEIQSLVENGDWGELEDAFYKHINIGTGGIRGAIGPGPN